MYATAHKMCEKAFELEPNNLLYEWGAKRPLRSVRKQVLADPKIIAWLESKGDYGRYLVSVLNTEWVDA